MDTRKLFISYRSIDAQQVDKIVADLELLRFEDGTTPRFETWQDKKSIPAGVPHWWDAIVSAIEDCDVFVFNMSQASLESKVCLAELGFAHKRNMPIIPLVLEGEFFVIPASGKYNINFWDKIPEWLANRQFMFFTGAEIYRQFVRAIEVFEEDWPPLVNAPRPLNPDNEGEYPSNHAMYAAAADYADRLAFADAVRLFESLAGRDDPDYGEVAADWLEIIHAYEELIEVGSYKQTAFVFKKKWAAYEAMFPKEFLDGIFDPKHLSSATEPPRTEEADREPVVIPSPQPVTALESQDTVESLFRAPIHAAFWIKREFSDISRGVGLVANPGVGIFASGRGTIVTARLCSRCTEDKPNTLSHGYPPGDVRVLSDPGWNYGYGHYVVIRYDWDDLPQPVRDRLTELNKPNVNVTVLYAHLSDIAVSENQVVQAGDRLGTIGNTGNTTGTQLFFDVRTAEGQPRFPQQQSINPTELFSL